LKAIEKIEIKKHEEFENSYNVYIAFEGEDQKLYIEGESMVYCDNVRESLIRNYSNNIVPMECDKVADNIREG